MSVTSRTAGRVWVAAAAAFVALLPAATPGEAQYAKNRPQLAMGVPELEMRAQVDSTDPLTQYDLAVGYWFHKRFDDAERVNEQRLPAHLHGARCIPCADEITTDRRRAEAGAFGGYAERGDRLDLAGVALLLDEHVQRRRVTRSSWRKLPKR